MLSPTMTACIKPAEDAAPSKEHSSSAAPVESRSPWVTVVLVVHLVCSVPFPLQAPPHHRLFVRAVVACTVLLQYSEDAEEHPAEPGSPRSPPRGMTPPFERPSTEKGVYDKAAVSADSVECAEIGCNILKLGGSAVDAAIATLLSVGVSNAHSMGIGGGFMMTVYKRDGSVAEVIDAREVAPGLATENMFQGNLNLTLRGGLSVAVPGELGGYWEAHQRHGRLRWSELFQPAIRLCREGHRIGFHMANALKVTREHILNEPTMRSIYVDRQTGDVMGENDVVRRPALGDTLETVARKGAADFYGGDLARQLVEDIKGLGGIISLEDLAGYRPLVKEPIAVPFENGLTMYNAPPPGSGALMAMILNVMDGYPMQYGSMNGGGGGGAEESVLLYHRFIEACKFTYARRTELGDEDFVEISELLRNVTSKEYAQSVREQIADNTTFEQDYYGAVLYQPDDFGTAHVAVVAPNGDAVSVTSSINQYFGAKICSASTGVILNNVMGDFSAPDITNYFGLPPSPSNFIRPGKRPLSSMCPAIFVDRRGDVELVIGAAGGTRITSGASLVAIRNLWLNEDIKMAIDRRRIHHQLFPHQLFYEKDFSEFFRMTDHLKGLEQLGHACKMYDTGGPIVVAVSRDADCRLHAYSDARKGGGTAGF